MKALRLVIFVLTFLGLFTQLIRHAYVRWLEPKASVLDKYTPLRGEIRDAKSLADLEKKYSEELAKARTKSQQLAKARAQERANEGSRSGEMPEDSTADPEFGGPTSPESMQLRQAIQDWENKTNEIRELRYFWSCGLLCLALAVVCYRLGWLWLSLVLQVAGFSEMLWWTSPSFRQLSAQEFTRLLDSKIIFTVLSLGILLAFWFTGLLRGSKGEPGAVA